MEYADDYKSYLTFGSVMDQGNAGNALYAVLTVFVVTEILEFADIALEASFEGKRSLLRLGTPQILKLVRTPSKVLRLIFRARGPRDQKCGVRFGCTRTAASIVLGALVIAPEVAIKMLGTLGGADVPHESMTGVRIDNVDGPGFVSRLSLGEFPSNFRVQLTPLY
jgi:hypothetical protein